MVAQSTQAKAAPSSTPKDDPEKGATPAAPTSSGGSNQAAPTTTSSSKDSSSSGSTSTKSSSSQTSSTTTSSHSPSSSPKPTSTSTRQQPSTTPPPKSTGSTASVEEKPKSTSTITITDHPESTFSSTVAISVTDPSNGKVALSTPPAVTSLSTSTETDGSLVTYTHIIANPPPTNIASGNSASKTGLLNNPGATAGVFVVVGVVVSALAVCLGLLIRRRRRSMRYKRYLESIQPPPSRSPNNPFADPLESPQMRAADDTYRRIWDTPGPAVYQETRQHNSARNSDHNSATGLVTGAPIVGHSESSATPSTIPSNHGHFDFVDLGRPLDRTNNGRVSVAETSPSIYPPSLPPIDDDDDFKLDPQLVDFNPPRPPGNLNSIPPRPPKSHLRRSIVKPGDTVGPGDIYPSPPASTRFRQPEWLQPPSPITEQPVHYKPPAIQRRTLLDVRPRHTSDGSQ